MGKQLIFYMDKQDEERFLNYIYNMNYHVYDLNGQSIARLPERYLFFLNKELSPNFVYKNNKINQLASKGIEFSRTTINEDSRTIIRGRLWISTFDNSLNGLDDYNDYNLMIKYIKRMLKKQSIMGKGKRQIYYISESLKRLVEDGYIFR